MIFSLFMLLNYISLLIMWSWIQCLKCTHSSKVCLPTLTWCLHFLDGSKLSRGGLSLGLANNEVTSFFSNRLVSPCMRHASICLMLWGALAGPYMSMLTLSVYTSMKPCWCTVVHQTRNSARFLLWKWCNPFTVFSQQKLGEDSILRAMKHLKQSVTRFSPWK